MCALKNWPLHTHRPFRFHQNFIGKSAVNASDFHPKKTFPPLLNSKAKFPPSLANFVLPLHSLFLPSAPSIISLFVSLKTQKLQMLLAKRQKTCYKIHLHLLKLLWKMKMFFSFVIVQSTRVILFMFSFSKERRVTCSLNSLVSPESLIVYKLMSYYHCPSLTILFVKFVEIPTKFVIDFPFPLP